MDACRYPPDRQSTRKAGQLRGRSSDLHLPKFWGSGLEPQRRQNDNRGAGADSSPHGQPTAPLVAVPNG